MRLITEFDIAALVLEALIIFFTLKKRSLPNIQNRLFLILTVLLTFLTGLDLWTSCININHPERYARWFVYLLNTLYLSGTPALSAIYAGYCLGLLDYWITANHKRCMKTIHLLFVPYMCLVIFVILSPVLKNTPYAVYYLGENNEYIRGGIGFLLLYIFSGIYLAFTLVIFIVYHNRIHKAKILMAIAYIVATLIAVLLQFFVSGLLIECFGLALCILCFLFFVQRPEEYLDANLNCFNKYAFNVMEIENFRHCNNHFCIAIVIDDTDFLAATFGLKVLNNLMRQVSDFLNQNFNPFSIYYLNKKTFCIVFKNPKEKEVNKSLTLLKSRFKDNWNWESVQAKLYARFCMIDCQKDVKSPEDILDLINMVITEERYSSTVIYSKDVKLADRQELARIEHCVRTGLSDNRFEVYYQPLYSTHEKRLIGAESLIRLKDENGQFLNPEVFVPIAEKNGAILRIGEFVFESVCKSLSSLNLKRLGIKKIDVNLSVAQCMQETLSDQIKTIRAIYQVPTEVLNLEITESASAHTPEILLKNMNELCEAGFELSMDDYGSGNSNMNYLLNLPFKMIKIDKFVVWAALKNERSKLALQHSIKMIKALNMTVLAEGVETKEQLDWLSEAGCDYLQGYYFSKPVPLEEYVKIMAESNADLSSEEEDIEELEEI